jgi:pilus assembly protein Flp/PilA
VCLLLKHWPRRYLSERVIEVELGVFIMSTEKTMNSESSCESAKKEAGATMIEYALLVALIAIIALAGVRFLGQTVSNQFSRVAETLNVNMNSGGLANN